MKRIALSVLCSVLGIGVLGIGHGRSAWGEPKPPAVTGRGLFQHTWTVRDALSPQGDGVGPVHNATSCVACHHLGGIGGAGPQDANIDLLTPVIRPSNNGKDDRSLAKLKQLHFGFSTRAATVMLHQHGTAADYSNWRLGMLGVKAPPENDAAAQARMWASLAKRRRTAPPIEDYKVSGVTVRLSHRSTPALFGAGLIDAIPDQAIQEQQALQAAKGTIVSGRAAPANPELAHPFLPENDPENKVVEGIGRFGWRGQTRSLREFVLGACANELGLEVPNHSQGLNPQNAKYVAPGLDLDQNQCEKLINFVRQLPRPIQIIPPSPDAAAKVQIGARAFRNVGCATCHVPDLGDVEGLFSDLLLHDMGPELADSAPANPMRVKAARRFVPMGYFGSTAFDVFADVPTPVRQEWRTTPLWGVADSAPYMHDGRAKSLEMAIALHGGEAAASRDEFRRLPGEEQQMLVMFLKTLRAPPSAVGGG